MPSLIGLRLFKLPIFTPSTPPPGTFQGQAILNTCANACVGLDGVWHVVHLGASHIILGVRCVEKGQPVKEAITSEPSLTTEIVVWEFDLDSFASVKAFAAKCEKLLKLDIAIIMEWQLGNIRFLLTDGR